MATEESIAIRVAVAAEQQVSRLTSIDDRLARIESHLGIIDPDTTEGARTAGGEPPHFSGVPPAGVPASTAKTIPPSSRKSL